MESKDIRMIENRQALRPQKNENQTLVDYICLDIR